MFCSTTSLSGRVKLASFMSQSCKDGYEMYKKVWWTCKTTSFFFAFSVAVAVVVAKAPYCSWSRYFTTKVTSVTWRQPLQKAHYLMVSLRSDIQITGAPNDNFRKISVRKTIWDLEFSEHLKRSPTIFGSLFSGWNFRKGKFWSL